jgi:hypothetical protein
MGNAGTPGGPLSPAELHGDQFRTRTTKDLRIRVAWHAHAAWRTEIRNDYDSDDWYPVGPAYPTAELGLAQVDDLLAFHFGGDPGRAELAGRIARALAIPLEWGPDDPDRVVRLMAAALAGRQAERQAVRQTVRDITGTPS